jgi:hypothetical protein
MKLALWIVMVVVCSNAYAQPGGPSKLLRRVSLASACAASFWDYATTAEGSALGAVERNSLLARRDGRPRLGLMLGLKIGMCGFSALSQESRAMRAFRGGAMEKVMTGVNFAMAANFARAAIRNRGVISQQRRASIPAYLAPQTAAGQ